MRGLLTFLAGMWIGSVLTALAISLGIVSARSERSAPSLEIDNGRVTSLELTRTSPSQSAEAAGR